MGRNRVEQTPVGATQGHERTVAAFPTAAKSVEAEPAVSRGGEVMATLAEPAVSMPVSRPVPAVSMSMAGKESDQPAATLVVPGMPLATLMEAARSMRMRRKAWAERPFSW